MKRKKNNDAEEEKNNILLAICLRILWGYMGVGPAYIKLFISDFMVVA